jgi:hypothetical protein
MSSKTTNAPTAMIAAGVTFMLRETGSMIGKKSPANIPTPLRASQPMV